ncbi:Cytochrome P450 CYP6 [Frankliniella occidentalis]|uniref:Probable cytochrome P450 6a13 isoform X2 n=1 Tax=Frankliniella occidentalis TaxID=133901 RepID=A0A9C6XT77_FRAOC|nr:probable cytochrome P450 6a13 isoform X2 [Frankliniella occidentalis]KAE8739399.1 Cytochrome P450 CYP6 [Frankliniella occidentalis]
MDNFTVGYGRGSEINATLYAAGQYHSDEMWTTSTLLLVAVLCLYAVLLRLNLGSTFRFHLPGRQSLQELPEALALQAVYLRARESEKTTPGIRVGAGLRWETLLVDLNVIHRVCTDNITFPDRGLPKNERTNPLSAHLFSLDEKRWRAVRDVMSRVLTPAKLKSLFSLHARTSQDLRCSVRGEMNSEGFADVDVKELMERFVTDDMGRTLFSVDCDALRRPGNPFHSHCAQSFTNSWWRQLRQRLLRVWPSLALRIPHRGSTAQFFQKMVEDLRWNRGHCQKTQADLLEAMFVAESSGGCPALMRSVEAPQMFASFRAGFEATAPTITFALLELAHNPNVQRRLQQELDTIRLLQQEVADDEDNTDDLQVTADALAHMEYLDCVIKETLRKYPPNASLVRRSSKPCFASEFGDSRTTVIIEEGERFVVPVYALHHDRRWFSDPERFDPDRFRHQQDGGCTPSNNNQKAYMPFGIGRRHCVARRYALQQVKVGLVAICSTFEVELCSKSPPIPPPFLAGRGIVLALRNECYLRLRLRNL